MPEEKEGEEKESEKIENIIAIGFVILVFFLMFGFWNSWWGLFDSESENPIVSTSITGEPIKGNQEARIIIVEYSDFECPFCGRWYKEVYPTIKAKYIDTGKAMLVFKQFPLTRIHTRAMPAAIASECAFRQGNDFFWQMHDKMFENQDALEDEDLKKYAEEAGLNSLQFDLCYSNLDTESEVSSDFSEGTQAGITGTPGFIIAEAKYPLQGELIVGAHPLETFEKIIARI